VGADGLGVGVDHDARYASRAQLLGGMHGAVVELNTLTDANRAGAKHQRLGTWERLRLVLLLVGAVIVGRLRSELGRTGVHHLVGRHDAPRSSERTDVARAGGRDHAVRGATRLVEGGRGARRNGSLTSCATSSRGRER